MFVELAAAGFLIGQYVYHRWIEDKPIKPGKPSEIQIPRVDAGTMIPLIYGRVRVRSPILAATSAPLYDAPNYQMNMFFVLGIPFADGDSTSRVHNMWAGDWKLFWTDNAPEMTGDGGPEGPITVIGTGRNGDSFGTGLLEFLNGNPSQELVQAGGTSSNAVTQAGRYMLRPRGEPSGDPDVGGFGLTEDEIPGYRGYISVFLSGITDCWRFGSSPTVPAYSFEASSYDTSNSSLSTYCRVGDDSNAINVLYDLLVSKFGKLGLSSSYIDISSFQEAQYVLHTESLGYSRCIDASADADEIIQEILKHIDGALRFNATTGKVEVKLIRNDYDPATVPHITKENCSGLKSFAMGGWTNVTNAITVVFTDRSADYQDGSVREQNQANASGQDLRNQIVLQYPGCCTEEQARELARREIAARSRPIMKMRAMVNRSFLRVSTGDAVKVTWSNPDVSGVIFRVANVERGTLESSEIALDLIQDYYYVHRGQAPQPPADMGGLVGSPLIGS